MIVLDMIFGGLKWLVKRYGNRGAEYILVLIVVIGIVLFCGHFLINYVIDSWNNMFNSLTDVDKLIK